MCVVCVRACVRGCVSVQLTATSRVGCVCVCVLVCVQLTATSCGLHAWDLRGPLHLGQARGGEPACGESRVQILRG